VIVLVTFPGTRKKYAYAAPDEMNIHVGDEVRVEANLVEQTALVRAVNPRKVPHRGPLRTVLSVASRAP